MKWLLALCLLNVSMAAYAVPVDQATEFAQERVIELPEDGQVWATIVCTSDDWRTNQKERSVVSWFASDPRLAGLAAQTKFYHLTASNVIFKHKFASVVNGQFPCVIVQRYDGTKAYKVSGKNMPSRANDLADAIGATLKKGIPVQTAPPNYRLVSNTQHGRILRPKPCPQPEVTPQPAQPAQPTTVVVDTPHVPDDVADEPEKPHWGGIVLLAGLGAVGVILYMFQKAVHGV